MLNETTNVECTPFYAQQAYHLRTFAQPKRYTLQEITAHDVDINHPQRAEVEAFIYGVFEQAYNANISMFMPNLVALRDAEGTLMAAFGWRSAATGGPLFLERYLNAPIEQVISEHLGREISREQITKIGNLAVANPRNAGILIAHIIQHSLDIGIEWCVATVHHTLQNALIKAGRDVYPLFPADKNRLTKQEQAKWGSYYKHTPQVVAIRGVAE
jgi:hypothetical protein